MNLLNLEMMNGTERIAEALQMRGLFVEVKDDFIYLTQENTKNDVLLVQNLLEKLNIPTFWQGEKFQVLVNRVPIAMMKKIMNKQGREFPVSMEGYHFRWRAFAQRRFGIKVNALELDPQMAILVKSLNLAGITSLAGCNGHHRYEPNVQLSGVFQGAWFKIIQERFLNNCSLNYKWEVHFGSRSGSCIIAEKDTEERFDMNLLYQDTVTMGLEIQKHAEEIRTLKNNTFKRNKDMKERAMMFLGEKDYDGLVRWMSETAA